MSTSVPRQSNWTSSFFRREVFWNELLMGIRSLSLCFNGLWTFQYEWGSRICLCSTLHVMSVSAFCLMFDIRGDEDLRRWHLSRVSKLLVIWNFLRILDIEVVSAITVFGHVHRSRRDVGQRNASSRQTRSNTRKTNETWHREARVKSESELFERCVALKQGFQELMKRTIWLCTTHWVHRRNIKYGYEVDEWNHWSQRCSTDDNVQELFSFFTRQFQRRGSRWRRRGGGQARPSGRIRSRFEDASDDSDFETTNAS